MKPIKLLRCTPLSPAAGNRRRSTACGHGPRINANVAATTIKMWPRRAGTRCGAAAPAKRRQRRAAAAGAVSHHVARAGDVACGRSASRAAAPFGMAAGAMSPIARAMCRSSTHRGELFESRRS